MKTFIWQGLDKHGDLVKGEQQAANKTTCKYELLRQEIFPLKITHISQSFCKHKINNKIIANFSRKFALLINSNIPLIHSLDIITQEETQPEFKTILQTIKQDLVNGNSITNTFKKHPTVFNELYCGLINVGEKTGNLDVILQYIAAHTEKIEQQKHKIFKALFYPSCVLIVAVIVTSILLLFVVTQFKSIFTSFGATLPLYTQCIISIAEFLKANILILLGGVIIGIFGLRHFKTKSIRFNQFLDNQILRIPIVGNIIKNGIIFLFIKTFAITFKSGVPILEALTTCAAVVSNHKYKNAIIKTATAISLGKPLHTAMQEQQVFPQKIIQLIIIGEESGNLDAVLEKIAFIYEEEISNATDNLNNLLEPLIMMILGIIVGGLVIGMYLPIFRLGKII